MNRKEPRRPAAFKLKDVELAEQEEPVPLIVPEPDVFAEAADGPVTLLPRGRRTRWMRLFLIAAGGLITLALGLAIDNLVRSLFERTRLARLVGHRPYRCRPPRFGRAHGARNDRAD